MEYPSSRRLIAAACSNLKTALSTFGTVESISAYSNINTLTWVVPGEMGGGVLNQDVHGSDEPWGLVALEKKVTSAEEGSCRCTLCGR